ncbi:MAG: hypothetical protein HC845_12365 [Akkermansiaceae bacterium]|nr:hypothetical protein [Akkermansiaceae bacterium]
MNSAFTISAAKPASLALNYEELRAEGLAYLEQVVSSLWTDYNIHDPGITLLELLCFGITDIAYRTSFNDRDSLLCQLARTQQLLHSSLLEMLSPVNPSQPMTIDV